MSDNSVRPELRSEDLGPGLTDGAEGRDVPGGELGEDEEQEVTAAPGLQARDQVRHHSVRLRPRQHLD